MTGAYRRPGRLFPTLVGALLSATLLASCVNPEIDTSATMDDMYPRINPEAGPPLPPGSKVEAPGTVPARPVITDTWEGSLSPDDRQPKERVPEIFQRGRLIVGVDQSKNLLSFRDPVSGQLRGFEVQLAKEIARDIFGNPEAVDFRFIEAGDSLRGLSRGDVDMVIRSVSVTEDRLRRMEFSTPYMRTQTRLLVMDNSGIQGIEDLAGNTVCVADGSTALQKTRAMAPESSILRTRNWSDCLMALQQQQAQAILGDDVVLAGIAAQDPYTRILPPILAWESYAVAIAPSRGSRDTTGLVRQVNATMERIQEDTTWWSMFNDWFGQHLYTYGPPPLQYRDEPQAEDGDDGETDDGQ